MPFLWAFPRLARGQRAALTHGSLPCLGARVQWGFLVVFFQAAKYEMGKMCLQDYDVNYVSHPIRWDLFGSWIKNVVVCLKKIKFWFWYKSRFIGQLQKWYLEFPSILHPISLNVNTFLPTAQRFRPRASTLIESVKSSPYSLFSTCPANIPFMI